MNKTFTIAKHEFTQTLRRISFIILTVALPVLAILGWGVLQGIQHWYQPGTGEGQKIGYVDSTGMFNGYASQPGFSLVKYPDPQAARADLVAREIKEYFVIPPDYLATGRIELYTSKKGVELSKAPSERIRDFLVSNLVAGKVSDPVLERVRAPMSVTMFQLDEAGNLATETNLFLQYALPYVFGLLFIFSIFFSSGYLLQGVSEEKESRVIEILLSSVSARQLLIGKILGLGAAGLCQIAIWLATIKIFTSVLSVSIPFLSGFTIPPSLLLFAILYFLLGYLLFAALFAALGAVGSTARETQQWSSIFTLPAILPYMLQMLIIGNPENAVSRAFTLFPLTAPITSMMRLPMGALKGWELALSLLILAGSVAVTMWAASKIFRIGLLMYGKRPSLREILRYVRE